MTFDNCHGLLSFLGPYPDRLVSGSGHNPLAVSRLCHSEGVVLDT